MILTYRAVLTYSPDPLLLPNLPVKGPARSTFTQAQADLRRYLQHPEHHGYVEANRHQEVA
jgi:hypothetical protein